jgi:hypothetical protein
MRTDPAKVEQLFEVNLIDDATQARMANLARFFGRVSSMIAALSRSCTRLLFSSQ